MDKLKPCPFCGNEPTLYQDEMTGHWAVRCVKDTHRPTLINSHGATAWCYSCTDPAEAIKAWNTRAERTCKNMWGVGFLCSRCGTAVSGLNTINYCPTCGAKVVSE